MLIDELKKAQMEALKTKDTLKRSVLQIVTGKVKLAEIEKRTKNESLTDDDVLLVINKVIKELDEEILAFKNANRTEKVEELTLQKQILEAYLPAKLTEEEIREIINSLEDTGAQAKHPQSLPQLPLPQRFPGNRCKWRQR